MSTRPTKPQAIGRQALADHVYEEIFASVIDGRLEASSSISIERIAREMRVSPTPVREALARLECTGLVLRMALRGYRVAPLFTQSDLVELLDARLVIEPVNALRACQRATPQLTDALESAIVDRKNAPSGGAAFTEYREAWEADERFHRLIAESAANHFLVTAYHSMGGHIQRFRSFGYLSVGDADLTIQEHAAILEAFKAENPEEARESMIAHISKLKDRSVKHAAEHS